MQSTESDLNFEYVWMIGEPGCGKTTLCMQNKNALVINLDLRSITPVVPAEQRAKVWPHKVRSPQTGRFILTGDHLENKKITWNSLVKIQRDLLANADRPDAPHTIVIDNTSTLLPIVKDAVVEYFNRAFGYSFLVFEDLVAKRGEAVWGHLTSTMGQYCEAFVNGGYGVVLISHTIPVIEKDKTSGATINTQKLQVSLTRGQIMRLQSGPSLTILVEKGDPVQVSRGVYAPCTRIRTSDPRIDGILKSSIPIPTDRDGAIDIVGDFSTVNHWEALRSMWNTTANPAIGGQ